MISFSKNDTKKREQRKLVIRTAPEHAAYSRTTGKRSVTILRKQMYKPEDSPHLGGAGPQRSRPAAEIASSKMFSSPVNRW